MVPANQPAKFATEGLTFDDVLLLPAASSVLPNEVSTASDVVPGMGLNVPILSAAMDTVTEAQLAIGMAQQGGIGVVHRNLSIDEQVAEVDQVEACRIRDDRGSGDARPEATVGDARRSWTS